MFEQKVNVFGSDQTILRGIGGDIPNSVVKALVQDLSSKYRISLNELMRLLELAREEVLQKIGAAASTSIDQAAGLSSGTPQRRGNAAKSSDDSKQIAAAAFIKFMLLGFVADEPFNPSISKVYLRRGDKVYPQKGGVLLTALMGNSGEEGETSGSRRTPKAPQASPLLETFDVLRTQLPKLLEALKANGITDKDQLQERLIAEHGLAPPSASACVFHFLRGHLVTKKGEIEPTDSANQVAAVAGLDPLAVYAPQIQAEQNRRGSRQQPTRVEKKSVESPLLETFDVLNSQFPELLAALKAKGINSLKHLRERLVADYKLAPIAARMGVSHFLKGRLVAKGVGRTMPTHTADCIAAIAGLDPGVIYAKLILDEQFRRVRKIEPRAKKGPAFLPLDGFKIFKDGSLSEVLEALKVKGIATPHQLAQNIVQEFNVELDSASTAVFHFLKGQVIAKTGEIRPSDTANRVAAIAGCDAKTVYGKFVAEEILERQKQASAKQKASRSEFRPAADGVSGRRATFRDSKFLASTAPELLTFLEEGGLTGPAQLRGRVSGKIALNDPQINLAIFQMMKGDIFVRKNTGTVMVRDAVVLCLGYIGVSVDQAFALAILNRKNELKEAGVATGWKGTAGLARRTCNGTGSVKAPMRPIMTDSRTAISDDERDRLDYRGGSPDKPLLFSKLVRDARKRDPHVLWEEVAMVLKSLFPWLAEICKDKKVVPGLMGTHRRLGTEVDRRFRDSDSHQRRDLYFAGVIEDARGFTFTADFVKTFNEKDKRDEWLTWTGEYGEYRKRIAGEKYQALQNENRGLTAG